MKNKIKYAFIIILIICFLFIPSAVAAVPPQEPILHAPAYGLTTHDENNLISVYVYDNDSAILEITFYHRIYDETNYTDEKIANYTVLSGTHPSAGVRLDRGETFYWYCVVSDEYDNSTSDIFYFSRDSSMVDSSDPFVLFYLIIFTCLALIFMVIFHLKVDMPLIPRLILGILGVMFFLFAASVSAYTNVLSLFAYVFVMLALVQAGYLAIIYFIFLGEKHD